MTLRDYFAAKALLGELSSQSSDGDETYNYVKGDEENLAMWCYEMADAMLKARQE